MLTSPVVVRQQHPLLAHRTSYLVPIPQKDRRVAVVLVQFYLLNSASRPASLLTSKMEKTAAGAIVANQADANTRPNEKTLAEAITLGQEPASPISNDELDKPDESLEKKLIRKCDLHLIPILFLLFLCAFIDR